MSEFFHDEAEESDAMSSGEGSDDEIRVTKKKDDKRKRKARIDDDDEDEEGLDGKWIGFILKYGLLLIFWQ